MRLFLIASLGFLFFLFKFSKSAAIMELDLSKASPYAVLDESNSNNYLNNYTSFVQLEQQNEEEEEKADENEEEQQVDYPTEIEYESNERSRELESTTLQPTIDPRSNSSRNNSVIFSVFVQTSSKPVNAFNQTNLTDLIINITQFENRSNTTETIFLLTEQTDQNSTTPVFSSSSSTKLSSTQILEESTNSPSNQTEEDGLDSLFNLSDLNDLSELFDNGTNPLFNFSLSNCFVLILTFYFIKKIPF
jgi:hypothetical protein